MLLRRGCFSVKSAYDALLREIVPGPLLSPRKSKIFSSIWDSPAPSKVIAFSWQLLHDRVPTKDNLLLRGVIHDNSEGKCVWCDVSPESSRHLFLHCKVAHEVWYEIFKWLGVVIVMPSNFLHLFECFGEVASTKKLRKGFRLVWHSVLWAIWRARNNKVFNNMEMKPIDIIEEVKVTSWKWSLERLKISPCLFYEWVWEPGICINS
ncbi:F-box family protein [Trifolium medium]|uniref:F-box family protein n=1 Tax=Trifolium medium TaxID=97028 RepID=A0A392MTC9_9FABA|nr:F-box family protein [Trifolium medium]